MAVVTGRLQIRRWQDKDGQNRRTAEVVAENIYFGEPKRRSEENDSYSYNSSSQRNNAPDYPEYSSFSEIDDSEGGDLPF
jgi:single-strand DNA-binding protein